MATVASPRPRAAYEIIGHKATAGHGSPPPARLAALVISADLRRRHLDESQRALVAAKLANIRVGEVAGNQHVRPSPIGEGQTTQGRAAELLYVGKRSVERAREVLDDGAPY